MCYYNPLLNDVVLTKVIALLPPAELLICRLVCRKWNYFVLPILRQTANITLNSTQELDNLIEISSSGKNASDDEYDYDAPCARFRISEYIPLDYLRKSQFLTIFSVHLTSLRIELDLSTEENIRDLFSLLFQLSLIECLTVYNISNALSVSSQSVFEESPEPGQRLQRLKTLELYNCNLAIVLDLFKAANQLESVVILDKVFTSTVLEALSLCNHSHTVKQLSLMDMDEENFDVLKDLISNKKMRLHSIQVKHFHANVRSTSLEFLLSSLKASLEEFNVGELRSDRELLTEIPTMPFLKKLAFTSPSGNSCKIFAPIDYPRKLANLTCLWLDNCRCDQLNLENLFPSYFDIHNETCSSLKEIRFPQYMDKPHLVMRIAKMFPFVKRVTIGKPTNNVLATLWTTWKNLKELEITITLANKNVDSLLSGISIENCMKLIGRNGNSLAIKDYTRKSEAALTDLKELTGLKIKTLYGYGNLSENSILVTDITGYFALAMMSSLKYLTIETNDLSEECREIMQNDLQLSTCKIERPQRDWSYSSIIDYNFQCLNWEKLC